MDTSLRKQMETKASEWSNPMALVACGSIAAVVEKYFNSSEFHDAISLMLLNSENQSHQEDVTDIINYILGKEL